MLRTPLRTLVPVGLTTAALLLTGCAVAQDASAAAVTPAAVAPDTVAPASATPASAAPPGAATVRVVTDASLATARSAWSGKVRAYGDSVMLGAKTALKKRLHAKVNAVVSRQSWTVLGKVRKAAKKGRIHGPVVIHTGTNGTVEKSLLLKTARIVPTMIVLVTAKADRSWVAGVNRTLRAVDAQRSDVVVFDWKAYSAGHGSWFYGDGIHLTSTGAAAYADGIAKVLHR